MYGSVVDVLCIVVFVDLVDGFRRFSKTFFALFLHCKREEVGWFCCAMIFCFGLLLSKCSPSSLFLNLLE